jgi:hypothetical protein
VVTTISDFQRTTRHYIREHKTLEKHMAYSFLFTAFVHPVGLVINCPHPLLLRLRTIPDNRTGNHRVHKIVLL